MRHRGIVVVVAWVCVVAGCPAPGADDGDGPAAAVLCDVVADCAAGPCEEARCIDGFCQVVPDTSDLDDDGVHCGSVIADCDDTNPFISPALRERCDNDVDDDCDGFVDADDLGGCGVACVDGWCFEGDAVAAAAFENVAVVGDDLWRFGVDSAFARRRGGHWSIHAVDGLEPSTRQPGAVALWGSGEDVWAVGRDLLRFDGRAWTTVQRDVQLEALTGTGPDDVWAAGTTLQHFDGSAWSEVATPAGGPFSALHIDALGRVVVAGPGTVIRGGLDGFELVRPLDGATARPGLDDVDGRLFIATADDVQDEDGAVLATITEGSDRLTLLMLDAEQALVGDHRLLRRVGDSFVGFDVDIGAGGMTRGTDGVPVLVDRAGTIYRVEDGALRATTMPLESLVASASVVDDDEAADGLAAWATFRDERWPSLQRRTAPGVWQIVDIDVDIANSVVALDAHTAWLVDSGRARLFKDDVVVAEVDRVVGEQACGFDGAAYFLSLDGALTRLDGEGGVMRVDLPGGAELHCFDTTMLIESSVGLLQPRRDGSFNLLSIVDRAGTAHSIGDEVRITVAGTFEQRLAADRTMTLVTTPPALRYAGASRAQHWKLEANTLVHVVDEVERRVGIAGNDVVAIDDVGDTLYVFTAERTLRWRSDDAVPVDIGAHPPLTQVQLLQDGRGIGCASTTCRLFVDEAFVDEPFELPSTAWSLTPTSIWVIAGNDVQQLALEDRQEISRRDVFDADHILAINDSAVWTAGRDSFRRLDGFTDHGSNSNRQILLGLGDGPLLYAFDGSFSGVVRGVHVGDSDGNIEELPVVQYLVIGTATDEGAVVVDFEARAWSITAGRVASIAVADADVALADAFSLVPPLRQVRGGQLVEVTLPLDLDLALLASSARATLVFDTRGGLTVRQRPLR